jgi:hypothetical protein
MEKITIDLIAKTDKAVKEVEELKKEIQELNKQVEKGNKDTKDGLKGVEKASEKTAGGVKKIGGALKAAGIGLAIAAFAKFTEVLNENQKVTDFFSITFETLSIAFNDFFNFINKNSSIIIDTFKSLFSDPVQTIKDFGNSIYEGLVVRFEQFKETLGFVAKGIGELFKGNFSDAIDSFKQAGKESIDIITGQDESFEKVKNTIIDYTKETISSAKSIVELNKSAEKARVINQGLIEEYDRQAEQQRQLRDNEFNTIEQRIEANNRLKEVLDKQKETMQDNADAIVAAAQAQYDKNQSDANFLELQDAKNEKLGIEAQIKGFMSEQDSNANALKRESLELDQSISDAEAERQQSKRDFDAEQIESEFLRLEQQKLNNEEDLRLETERLEAKRALYKEGTQSYEDANNELLAYQQENANNQVKIEKDLNKSKQQLMTDALGNLASLVGKSSKFGKAIAIVQAIRDTFAGANKALAASPPPFNFIAAAAVTAAGIANVKTITSSPDPTPPAGLGASGGGAVSSPAVVPPAPPAFNIVGDSGTNQLAEAIGGQAQQPIKAFVVSNDVTTSQELDRNIVEGASI